MTSFFEIVYRYLIYSLYYLIKRVLALYISMGCETYSIDFSSFLEDES